WAISSFSFLAMSAAASPCSRRILAISGSSPRVPPPSTNTSTTITATSAADRDPQPGLASGLLATSQRTIIVFVPVAATARTVVLFVVIEVVVTKKSWRRCLGAGRFHLVRQARPCLAPGRGLRLGRAGDGNREYFLARSTANLFAFRRIGNGKVGVAMRAGGLDRHGGISARITKR